MRKTILKALTIVTLISGAPAFADGHIRHEMQGVSVTEAWARASVGGNGAAYVTIANHGKHGDRLIAAEADVARKVEIHTHIKDGNFMRMRRVDHVVLGSGKTVTMTPGGHHVMLMGLKRKLKQGETFPLTLVFEKAGKIKTTVSVKEIGAMKGGGMSGGHGGHGKMKH